MKRRFVQINGELVEVGLDYQPLPKADYYVMPDFQPFVDNTGTHITGRAHYREHLASRGAVEMGHSDFPKDPSKWVNPSARNNVPSAGRKEALKLAYDKMVKFKRPKSEVRALLDNVIRREYRGKS